MSQITLKVNGMSCNHCKAHVEKALKDVAGAESVSVDLDKGEAVISGTASKEALVKAVEEAGYSVSE